jgi:hypothetical protein
VVAFPWRLVGEVAAAAAEVHRGACQASEAVEAVEVEAVRPAVCQA